MINQCTSQYTVFKKKHTDEYVALRERGLAFGNKETIYNILGKNSILYFMVTHYYKNKKKFENDMVIHSNIAFIRLRTPKEAEAFLQSLN